MHTNQISWSHCSLAVHLRTLLTCVPAALAFVVALAMSAVAQSGSGSTAESQATFQPGQRVEARWRSSPTSEPWDRWDPATLLEVGNGASLAL
jgi:hypothetical protein